MGRLIAIGDIHGCAKALRALLEEIAPCSDDTIVTLGDCVDRGADSRGVLEQLLELRTCCQFRPLMGNHERMMLSVVEGTAPAISWQIYGGRQTLASYGNSLAAVPPEHIELIRSFAPFVETDDHIFAHANYVAELPMADQPEHVLYWEHLSATFPPPHHSDKRVILGHTPQLDGDVLDAGHLVCIDTYCFAGGWLTALDVHTNQLWQVGLRGNRRDGAAPNGKR